MISCNVNIPFYGKGKLLRAAIRSVATQDIERERLSVTVFDDNSPEAASGALSGRHDASVGVIRNPQNLGMVRNWNRCLEFGDGEYVHVLHYDDLLQPTFYSEVLRLFDAHQNLGLVYTGSTPIFSRRTSTRFWGAVLDRGPMADDGVTIIDRGDEAVRHLMRGVVCSSAVLRRETIRDVGLFREDLTYSSDEEYWGRIAARWGVAYVRKPLIRYRYHEKNYQLTTWTKPDFWEKWCATRVAQINHLRVKTDRDANEQAAQMARVAVGIAMKLLAKGNYGWASKYLDHAIGVYPKICTEVWFRRVSSWISEGFVGRTKAWLRSAH